MSACCPPRSEGAPIASTLSWGSFLGAASPSGRIVEIPAAKTDAKMPCYVTGAPLSSPNLKHIILVFTDVFGFEAGNHKLFADVLASRLGAEEGETTVLLLDLFRGNPIAQPISFLPEAIGMIFATPAMVYRLKVNHPPAVIERELTQLIFPWIQSQAGPNLAKIGTSCSHASASVSEVG